MPSSTGQANRPEMCGSNQNGQNPSAGKTREELLRATVLEPETIGVKVVHLITNGLTVMCRWQKSYQTFAAAQLRK